jgi:type IV pilus assembly protein PilB
MTAPRVRLGDLLVEAQIITREQLEDTQALQKKDGRRLGTLLVATGMVTETQVTQILSQQLSVPWVSLYHIDFSRQLLNLVPCEVAEKYSLVPIFVRRVRGSGETLYLAMDNPEDEAAKEEVGRYSGLPVRAMIAPLSDIQGAIRAYYGGAPVDAKAGPLPTRRFTPVDGEQKPTPSQPPEARGPVSGTPPPGSVRPSRPAPARPSEPARRPASVRPASLRAGPPPKLDTLPPDSGPQISARDISLPPPRRGKGKMIAVTLLDGTTINLPARRSARSVDAPEQPPDDHDDHLTARDLVAALRAVSHGADASEVLGEHIPMEKLFAALLSVLLRKHLIADWEFVEEFKKI